MQPRSVRSSLDDNRDFVTGYSRIDGRWALLSGCIVTNRVSWKALLYNHGGIGSLWEFEKTISSQGQILKIARGFMNSQYPKREGARVMQSQYLECEGGISRKRTAYPHVFMSCSSSIETVQQIILVWPEHWGGTFLLDNFGFWGEGLENRVRMCDRLSWLE